jgi:hypothetical protein
MKLLKLFSVKTFRSNTGRVWRAHHSFNNDPPPYEIAATDKLPEYSPRIEPPSYEEIHVSGVEHRSEDSLEISTNDAIQNDPIEVPVRNISFHVTGTITIRWFYTRTVFWEFISCRYFIWWWIIVKNSKNRIVIYSSWLCR